MLHSMHNNHTCAFILYVLLFKQEVSLVKRLGAVLTLLRPFCVEAVLTDIRSTGQNDYRSRTKGPPMQGRWIFSYTGLKADVAYHGRGMPVLVICPSSIRRVEKYLPYNKNAINSLGEVNFH